MPDRRAFLSGLVSLPLIGGAVTLTGRPTAAAVPVTYDLLDTYGSWLAWERFRLLEEMHDREVARRTVGFLRVNTSGERFHNPTSGDPACPSPRTRTAVVLSAVGCPMGRLL